MSVAVALKFDGRVCNHARVAVGFRALQCRTGYYLPKVICGAVAIDESAIDGCGGHRISAD